MTGRGGESEGEEQAPRNPGEEGSALVLGATGLVGGALVHLLLQDPRWKRVHLLLRRPPPPALRHPRLTHEVLPPGEWGGDPGRYRVRTVFVTLGTTRKLAGSAEAFRQVDLHLVVAAARAAEAGGARQFQVVSSVGADPGSRFLYPRTKGEMEREVSLLEIPSIVILRPSLLLGERDQVRPGEKVAEFLLRPLGGLLRGPLKPLRPIHARQVASAMAGLAWSPGEGISVLEPGEIRKRGRSGS